MVSKEYLAGFFDGEGSVMIESYQLRLVVSITNTSYEALQLFQSQYGSKINTHTVTERNAKPLFYWRLRQRRALEFLEDIEPYVRLKARHIELARAFIKATPDSKLVIKTQLRTLNQRGKIKESQLPLN